MTNLGASALTSHGKTERMATTAVCTSLLQTLNIIKDLSAEIVLDLHIGENGSEVKNLFVGEFSDAAGWVDVETG